MDVRRLRSETRKEHEATEALLPLMDPGLRTETYVEALCAMLPIVEGWEFWAAENAPPQVRPMLRRRRRGHLLRQDLKFFGVDSMSSISDRPVDWNHVVSGARRPGEVTPEAAFDAGFMGALYVMEGSSLGGRYIAKHVESALGLKPGHGDAYFLGHGEATGAVWRETLAVVGAVPEEQSNRVVAAAKRTFVAFAEALRAASGECGAAIEI